MRKLVLAILSVCFCYLLNAQITQVIQLSANETKLELKDVNPEAFTAKIYLKELNLTNNSDANGDFSFLEVEGLTNPANVGQANLPVISKLIEVPYGAEIVVNIKSYNEEIINLNDYGINRIAPTQPSYSKSTPEGEYYFVIDEEYYNTDAIESNPLITTEIQGIMRGVRIGRIEIRPWHYNPVENTLIVYNNLDFEVTFVGADIALTEEMKNKYYSPEFEGSFQSMLNYIAPAAKDAFSNYAAPVKFVIVANTAFQTTLQPFVQWKTKQGYNVIEYYVATGTTNTSIKTYLQGLYTAGTPTDPAPLYVMIIGDHSGTYAIPAFASTATTPDNSHITDVYFATYDGASDYIPDLYYGRISANSTTELSNALNKILPYEQYTIPDGSYLDKCMLIAGVDATYAKSHGDGTIYYGINEYFNTDHGFSNIYAYFHTLTTGPYQVMSSANSAADADMRTKIGAGLGFANYTAHCDYDGWADPNFPRSEIANMNNINKYPFLVANCCLSFEFNQSDAFGEMILYAQDEGAIGYIGTSNSSYWNEDVYWGIGLTSLAITQANVTNHNYSNTGLGAYDGIWHENGEAYSDWYYSGRQIAHKGNLAVNASTSTYKKYYWEIYHLVGDPSLIPYMTVPEALSLSFTTPPTQGATTVSVTTEAYTYVAISKNNVLLDAEWSGAGTTVTLTVPALTGEAYCVVGTKQDRAPYINENVLPISANPPVAAFSGTPTSILEGESVTFTDASQYPTEWLWDFGDTQTSTEQNPVHTYTTAGNYTVSLTVTNPTDSDNETKPFYITVSANTNPPTADFVADDTDIIVGGTVNFTDLSINNPSTWSWEFEGGTPATSDEQNPSIVYNTPGTYTVSLITENAYGDDDEVKIGYINVTVPDLIMSDGTSTQCSGLFKDPGGDANYGNNVTYTHTIYPSTPGSFVQLSFSEFSMEPNGADCYDYITIYNGENTSAPEIGTYCGSDYTVIGTNGVVTSTDASGALTIYFLADPAVNELGWVAEISCFAPTIPPTADFSSDVTSTCAGAVQFIDESFLAETWEWSFGDGTGSDEQNPLHYYTESGTFTVSLTVNNAYGDDIYTVIDMITVNLPDAPITTGDESCGPASLTLTATGLGTLAWYDAPADGNEVTTGSSYTNTFSETTTLYVQSEVENLVSGNVGPADYSIGTAAALNSTTAHGLYFNAESDFKLVSVVIYSSTTGNKTINLNLNGGPTLQTKTVNVTSINTPVVVTLDWDIPAADGYRLLGTANNRLYRNDAGPTYPYEIDGVVSIYGNTADLLNYYYFFYNWEVEYNVPCVSARVPATATINDLPVIDLGTAQTQCGGTVNLDAGAGFTSYVWNGTPGSQTYEVSTTDNYAVEVEDINGCTAGDNVDITINTVPTAVNVSGGTTQCGGIVDLDATGGAGGTIYWQGTTQNGTSTVTPTTAQSVNESGTYYFRSRSAEGCWGDEGSAVVVINEIPAAVVVSGGGTQCGGSMTLTATNGGEGTIYWQNTTSGGTSTVNPATQETISVSGTYYFRARSAEGCWGDEGSASVTIYPGLTAVATAVDESAPDANDGSVTVEMTGGTAPFTGTWTPSGTTNTAGTSMTLSDLAGGSYSVIVEDANGCIAEASAIVSTIGAPPVAAFEADVTEACDNLTVQFTDLSTNNPTSWAWDFGDGANTNVQNPSHTYTEPGYYTVSLIVDNGTDSDTEIIENYIFVGESPSLEISMTQVTVLGNDGTATVTVTGGDLPYSYEWSIAGDTETITSLSAGEYCVTVTESGNNCQASDCIIVTEQDPLTPPVANFSADHTMGCETLTVQFTDLSTNNPTSWAWNFGDGSESIEQNPEHTYTGTGLFTVSLVVENADGDDELVMSGMIFIGAAPVVTVDVVSASGEFVADGSAAVVITGGTAPFTITWSNEESGTAIDNLLPGNYSVMVVDVAGCVVTTPFIITWTSGIVDNQSILSIYPNPAKYEITVATNGMVADYIDFVNVLGQSIMKINPDNVITNINISGFEAGIYLVKVYANGSEYVTRLVIQ